MISAAAATGGNAFLRRRRWRLRRRIDKRLLPAINSPVQCSTVEKTRVKFGSFMQKQREALLDESGGRSERLSFKSDFLYPPALHLSPLLYDYRSEAPSQSCSLDSEE